MQPPDKTSSDRFSRREFVKKSVLVSAGVTAGMMSTGNFAYAAPSETLRVGLIGCGGRGTGAASQAMKADPNVHLVAMGDVFEDHLVNSRDRLLQDNPEKMKVTPEMSFVGLDAYQKVIDSGVDVVLLAAPPAFRPEHTKAAVAAGKHIFAEKPIAVDGPGVRSVLASAALAKQKGLSVLSGFCFRYEKGLRAGMQQVHDGAIGDILTINSSRYGGTITSKFTGARLPGQSDLEWQLRNWYYFNWLSGDHLVEQIVHSVDKMAWLVQDRTPAKVIGSGGRAVPNYGNIYDHFNVRYEYDDGLRTHLICRQYANGHTEQIDQVYGTKGTCLIERGPHARITGAKNWQFDGDRGNMYQTAHDEFFAAIRAGRPINDGVWMSNSTLMAIMGRMAAYTGQEITWEQALNSQEDLMPPTLAWDAQLDFAPLPVPGATRFI